MQLMIYKSHNHKIEIAFPLKHEFRQRYRYKYKRSIIKNLPTNWETEKENQGTNENILVL